jgi:hypothetical protein
MLAYYGVKLSDNWIETPEGYVVFKNAVIARTGFQKYKLKEIDEGERQSQKILGDPEEEVELLRTPEEVFNPRTIASFETKSVTDGHPDQLLNVDTVREHEKGQIANVRRGAEALESGDFPLLADLIVKDRFLIEKIKAGLRELSCGYNYHVLRQGDSLLQVDIVGNHVAIVNAGRAGPEASIQDSLEPTSTGNGVFDMSKFIDGLLGRTTRKTQIQSWAATAKPEDVAMAMDAMAEELEKKKEGADARDESMHKAGCNNNDCKGCKDEKPANDAKAVDRKRFHDALDRMLDGKEEEMNAQDADMESLKAMFTGGEGGKGEDETVAGEQTGDEMPEDGGIESGKDAIEALTIEPGDRPESTGTGTDSAALLKARKEGANAAFKAMKPFIAATKNKTTIGAFDTAVKTVNGGLTAGGTAGKGGYGAVQKAAASTGKDALDQKAKNEAASKKFQTEVVDAYAARRNQRN